MKTIPKMVVAATLLSSVSVMADPYMTMVAQQVTERQKQERRADLENLKEEISKRGEVALRACSSSVQENVSETKIIPLIENEGIVYFPKLISDLDQFLNVSDKVLVNYPNNISNEDLSCLYGTIHLVNKSKSLLENFVEKHKSHVNSLRLGKYVSDKTNEITNSVKENLISFGNAIDSNILTPIADIHGIAVEQTADNMMDVHNGVVSAKNSVVATANEVSDTVVGTRDEMVNIVLDKHAVAVDYTADRMMDVHNGVVAVGDKAVEIKDAGLEIHQIAVEQTADRMMDAHNSVVETKKEAYDGLDGVLNSIGNWFINLMGEDEEEENPKN